MYTGYMGNVIISPNLHKKSEMIDPRGNIINPRTKQIIKAVEQEYQPTPEEMAAMFSKEPAGVQTVPPLGELEADHQIPKRDNPLAAAIKAQVQKAVQEQIKKVDIAGMVEEAMKDAFK